VQKYTIGLSINEYNKLRDINAIKELEENIGILISKEDYSEEIGIKMPIQLGIAEFI
jgi:hypothetical protein